MYIGVYISVVYGDAESGHCQGDGILSGSFTSHSKSMRRHRRLSGHASHDMQVRSTQSRMLKGEKSTSTTWPERELNPRTAGLAGECSVH